MTPIIAVALIIATAIPLIVLYVIYTRDLYATGAFRVIVLCVGWGAVAFVIARFVNPFILQTTSIGFFNLVRYVAPITEEVLKALILVVLVRRNDFTYFVDGAIYGFAIGIGFAIPENFDYVLGSPNLALTIAVGRVLSTTLIHASASAMVGITLGLARFRRAWLARAGYFVIGLALAYLVHGGFNNLTSRISPSGLLIYLYAGLAGFGGLGAVYLILRRGLAEEQQWIEEMLGVGDRVTANEAAVVQRLAEAGAILAPVVERFGEEKAAQIGRFLQLQARLGILRKTLERLPDEEQRRDARAQIDGLTHEIDEARRLVGSYAMLFLRNIYPEQKGSVWGRLELTIRQREEERPPSMNLMTLMAEFPPLERRIVRLLLRNRGRLSAEQIVDGIRQIPGMREKSERAISEALDWMTEREFLARTTTRPIVYRVRVGRTLASTLTRHDIWVAIDALAGASGGGTVNVW